MMKRIVLCADDYGQAPGVSQGIIQLVKLRRLTATSCLTNMPGWLEQSNWLIPIKFQVSVGLHFNLTEGQALSASFRRLFGDQLPSLSRLMRLALLRQLDQEAVEAECEAQLASFQQGLGGLPQFLDGHQHIHQLPVIRDAVLAVYERTLRSSSVPIRLVNMTPSLTEWFSQPKKWVIKLTGGYAMQQCLQQRGIPHNPSFAGLYSLAPGSNYAPLFRRFLQESVDGGWIMCHPGLGLAAGDVIGVTRNQEYAYFASDQFLIDCQAAGVVI